MINNTHNRDQSIVAEIKDAARLEDVELLESLIDRYKQTRLSEAEIKSHRFSFNELLHVAAEKKQNDIALLLVNNNLADINHKHEILKYDYPSEDFPFFKMESVSIECYFLDMLIYWDNIDLFRAIGADKFSMLPYIVTERLVRDAENTYVNINNFVVEVSSGKYADSNEYNKALNTMQNYRSIRLLWLSTLCHWLLKHNEGHVLDNILKHYPYGSLDMICFATDRVQLGLHDSSRTCTPLLCRSPSTIYLINKFKELESGKNSRVAAYKYAIQYNLDTHLSLPCTLIADQEFSILQLANFASIMAVNNQISSGLKANLQQHYDYRCRLFALYIVGVMLGTYLTTLALIKFDLFVRDGDINVNNLSQTEIASNAKSSHLDVPGGVAALVFAVMFGGYAASLFARLAMLWATRIVSCGYLEVNGSLNTVAIRAYTNLLLQDLNNMQQESINEAPQHAKFMGCCFKRSSLARPIVESDIADHSCDQLTESHRLNMMI